MNLTEKEIQKEAKRLYSKLHKLKYDFSDCLDFAPLTFEINKLKKKKNAVILAHNYMPAEIIAGIADFTGDSLDLSLKAMNAKQKSIVFCGVHFMAETAKILNPKKNVLIPSLEAGCSLAESINAVDLKKLKQKNPNSPVVTYINSSAETKALSDSVCTSANALKIIESFKEKKIIFVPDAFMGKNLQKKTKKKLILWKGKCIAHEKFNSKQILKYKKMFSKIKVMSHLECSPKVIALSDFAGGTNGMIKYVEKSSAKQFLVVTECGMSDVLRMKFPEKEFLNPCSVCPYMKKISLENVLISLKKEIHKINVKKETEKKAKKSLDYMLSVK
ncbi:MAG: quinolinate synthase NadA [Candidatus Diapherotrites archaeon]|nr:quinolinate synthase NadA [Candidatus Diapherotrites archaeon]